MKGEGGLGEVFLLRRRSPDRVESAITWKWSIGCSTVPTGERDQQANEPYELILTIQNTSHLELPLGNFSPKDTG